MKLAWRNILFGLLLFWFCVLVYMSLTLYQSNDRSGITDQTQSHLMEALTQLDELKRENKKLYSIAKQLQKEMSLNKHRSKPSIAAGSINQTSGSIKHPPIMKPGEGVDLDDIDLIAPSQSHEILRRAVGNGVHEQWYYVGSQLRKLRQDVDSKSLSLGSVVSRLDDIISTGADYRRSLVRDLNNLTQLSSDWRKRESEELSKIVQARIRYTQNPKDCSKARKLVCNLNKGCGYGCQLHHVVYCFLIAHGTGRTMILESNNWRYSSGGWEKYFKPVSDTCTDRSGAMSRPWGPNVEDVQVVQLPIVDSLQPRPPYMPQAIPADLADRLIRLHGHPFVWWVGQFLKYLLRPQPGLASDMEEVAKRLNFINPIVGVHIRRTDKVHSEAAYHSLEEYMTYVEEYFDQMDAEHKMSAGKLKSLLGSDSQSVQRRVYLASDDPNVLDEAKRSYPRYEFISDTGFAQSASLSHRYTDASLRAIILDIHFLSITDYLVCTFSSQVCRVAYEIMQTLHPDASTYFKSLDDIYYFGGQNGHSQVAIADHKARPNSEEIDLAVGDVIGIAGNHWDGFSKGMNRRTGRTGIYPSYKVRENIDVANFPISMEKIDHKDETGR